MKKISIIVPTYNEEKNVRLLAERINDALTLEGIVYEIIFIDDHSTDNTKNEIKYASFYYPISVYDKKGEKGKARSLLEGFSHAEHDVICMIDADLQYPPEAIPRMLDRILNGDSDIIVANRKDQRNNLLRKMISKLFLASFGKYMHKLECDVQSGLKVFKTEIVKRLQLTPSPWSFDLEFLVKARNAGYSIGTHDITFGKRNGGVSKVNILKTSFEIGWNAIKLWIRNGEIIPLLAENKEEGSVGFHYKGRKFLHYANLDYQHSAFYRLSPQQQILLVSAIALLFLAVFVDWRATIILIILILTFLYFSDLLFNLFLILRSLTNVSDVKISKLKLSRINDKELPVYTIFCPLYKEWDVLPQFITAVSRLNYPKDKLQVLLLLEENDAETIKEVKKMNIPLYFQIVIVPNSLPKTKPKALNYGLKHAYGEYVVIYDAEDVPEADQLKKAVLAFSDVGNDIICFQAKLNFYNPHQNTLTKIFTAEYSLWFDLVLTGLNSINAPIPLGGTSNHFRTKDLKKKLKGWDAFNVTEDCDLGMRLSKNGYKTSILDSVTLEEANSDLLNWLRQRNRWIKGYIQTYLVHMRTPKDFIRDWKEPHLVTFQLVVGGKILSMFINPLMWLTTLVYFMFRPTLGETIESFFPQPALYLGVFSMVFGNFLYLYYYMIGCIKRGQYDITKYVFLVPFYWLFMSFAAWIALYNIVINPYYWSKTIHGLHLSNKKAVKQAIDSIGGRDLVDGKIASYFRV